MREALANTIITIPAASFPPGFESKLSHMYNASNLFIHPLSVPDYLNSLGP